ncbi:MAG: hypothetical protein NTZ14_06595, partial [Hyphomicrobiales bacterium]|nr:hypothetical protein [Hyphomicrobiales bacterium]
MPLDLDARFPDPDAAYRAIVEAHRGLAVIAYDLGELSKALVHLKRVSELDPKDSRPSRLSGLINKDMSQDPDAEAAYREALRRGLPPEGEREV